jgi:hypothetical protein
VVHRQVAFAVDLQLVGEELQDVDAIERPAVRPGVGDQLAPRLRQGDVQAPLTHPHTIEQVLHRQRGLAGAGIAVDQVEAAGNEPTVKYFVQPGHTSRRTDKRVARHDLLKAFVMLP